LIDYGVGQFEFDGLGVVQAGFELAAEGHESSTLASTTQTGTPNS